MAVLAQESGQHATYEASGVFCCLRRSKMPMVVQQSLGLAERLRAYGPSRDVEVQDAMARITLDVILTTGFDLPSNAVDLDQPCPMLEDMHFLMAETFRSALPACCTDHALG